MSIKKRMVGNNVSHSNVKTKRTFGVNAQSKVIKVDGKKIRVKMTTRTMRTLRKYGNTIAAIKKLIK